MDSLTKILESRPPLYQSAFYDRFDEQPIGTILWRPLSWGEAKNLYHLVVVPSLEDQIFERCVVECTIPKEELERLAGLISTVVSQIMYYSGVFPQESILDNLADGLQIARVEVSQNIYDQITGFLCSVFNYKPEEVDDLPWPILMKRIAQAEKIAGEGLPAIPLEIKSAQEEPKKFNLSKEIVLTQKEWQNLKNPNMTPEEVREGREMKQRQMSNLREQYFKNRGR